MAGLFDGLMNYDKPGPGVDKKEPKKKGIALFFSIFKQKFWKLIPLSLLYVLVSLPFVTVGLGDVGITYVTRNFVLGKAAFVKDDFFGAIKQNWKQALAVGFLNLAVFVLLLFGVYFYFMGWNESIFFKIGLVISGCVLIVFVFMRFYINTLIVTFDLKIKQLYKNSLLLSSAGLKENLIISVSLLLLYALIFVLPILTLMYLQDMIMMTVALLAAILFLPAVRSLIIQFCVFPVVKKHMIDPYYEQHPEAKKEKQLLNLDDGEEETDDAVFKDMGKQDPPSDSKEGTFPKQYSEREWKSARRKEQPQDDDDTF